MSIGHRGWVGAGMKRWTAPGGSRTVITTNNNACSPLGNMVE